MTSVNPHLLSLLSIEPQHATVECQPATLLSPRRLDIIAKYVYAADRVSGLHTSWSERTYREHLRVWNGFVEGDGSGKRSFADYIAAYDGLIDSFRRIGFDARQGLIPVDRNNVIIDGAHRIAAALAVGCTVNAVRFNTTAAAYDYTHFINCGMDAGILEYLVFRYCQLDSRVRIAVIFPVARGGEADSVQALSQWGGIVYRKAVAFTQTGRANLIRLLYRNEAWLGDGLTPTDGFQHHVTERFLGSSPVTLLFFVAGSADELRQEKARLRDMFEVGNDSIHINDNHHQSVALAEAFLNSNGIHFLNHAQPAFFATFHRLMGEMRGWIGAERLDPKRFCIAGSAVLSAYGLRDANDLDYLCAGSSPAQCNRSELICLDNDKILRYGLGPVDNLVMNPENHFYFDGMKFLSLSAIRELKARRSGARDLDDLRRIDALEGATSSADRTLDGYRTLPDRIREMRRVTKAVLRRRLPRPLLTVARAICRSPRTLAAFIGPYERELTYRGFSLSYSAGTSLIEAVRDGSVYEPEVSGVLIDVLHGTQLPTFVDVGANIGLITLNVLAEVSDVRVFAFEPGPHQADLLRRTIGRNGLEHRVTLVEAALGEKSGSSSFAVHRTRHASGDGFMDTRRSGRTRTLDVPVMTMDAWWKQAQKPRIDAIKIDTEGAELWVLEGGVELLRAHHPAIVLELHPLNLRAYPYEASDILRFLQTLGYGLTTLGGFPVNEANLAEHLEHFNDYLAIYGSHDRGGRL
jgi:FkbM family methyltransferase